MTISIYNVFASHPPVRPEHGKCGYSTLAAAYWQGHDHPHAAMPAYTDEREKEAWKAGHDYALDTIELVAAASRK